jgi:uncharacterized protein
MRTLTIRNARTGRVIASRARLCNSLWCRFRGLMLSVRLPEGEGLLLSPCGSVHMALMRFAIDVVYLDREGRCVKLVSNLKPYRISFGGRRAHNAIELPAGTIARMNVEKGDELLFEDQSGEPVRI